MSKQPVPPATHRPSLVKPVTLGVVHHLVALSVFIRYWVSVNKVTESWTAWVGYRLRDILTIRYPPTFNRLGLCAPVPTYA